MTAGKPLHPLVHWILARVPERGLHRALVVAPSAAAAAMLRRSATEARGALCGIHFVTPMGLADDLLLLGGEPFRRPKLDPLEEREMLRSCLGRDPLGEYVGRFDAALVRLQGAVRELEHHAITVRDTTRLTPWGRQVADVAARFWQRAADRDTRGHRMASALDMVAGGRGGLPAAVLVTGFARLDRDLRLLLAALAERGVSVEQAPFTEHRPADVVLHGCPGFGEELRLAARSCMAAAQQGIAWHDMVVAAPSLGPYGPHLRRAFVAEGVPFRAVLESPLIRHPRPALCLHAARLLFLDAPRESWMALATSPLVARFAPAEHQAWFDRRSRELHLHGHGEHVAAFADGLRQKLEGSPLAELVEAVHGVHEAGRQSAMTAWVRDLQHFLAAWLRTPGEQETAAGIPERLDECLHALSHAAPGKVSAERFVHELEDMLLKRGIELPGQTRGGVQVVSHEGALAHPCQHLHLLGLAEGMVPGMAPAETFLVEEDRRALGLWHAESERQHQEQLLARLLAHAPRLVLSFPRRNALGLPVGHTSWLDRIQAQLGEVGRKLEPGHPETRSGQRVASGSCPRDLALEHLLLRRHRKALEPTHPALLRDMSLREATLVLSWARDLDQFGAGSLRRDGDVGTRTAAQLADRPVSPSALDTLARCPHRFLFERGMRLRALPEELEVTAIAPNAVGNAVHTCLERLYGEFRERINGAEDPRMFVDEMQERTRELLREELTAVAGPLLRELPGLYRLIEDSWRNGIARLVRDDLGRLARDGARIVDLERQLDEVVSFPSKLLPAPVEVAVRGRLDRLDRLPDGSYRVIDFKTGRDPTRYVDLKSLLRGQYPQLPVYAMLVEAATGEPVKEVEVGAVLPYVGDRTPQVKVRHPLPEKLQKPGFREGLLETHAVVGALRERGTFTPFKDDHCNWCPFQLACRRLHPPSVDRVGRADVLELRQFKRLRYKTTRTPLLYRERSS